MATMLVMEVPGYDHLMDDHPLVYPPTVDNYIDNQHSLTHVGIFISAPLPTIFDKTK